MDPDSVKVDQIQNNTKVVQVSNIAPQGTIDQMYLLFRHLGEIEEIQLYPKTRNASRPVLSRICYLKFVNEAAATLALYITNTVFIDRALIVLPVIDGEIPNQSDVLKMTQNGAIVPGLYRPKLPPHVCNSFHRTGENKVITTHDPHLIDNGLCPYPPLPATYDSIKVEETRRTVQLINMDPTTSTDEIIKYFSPAGEVKYLRVCECPSDDTTHILIEFSNQPSVINALKMNGEEFRGKPLEIVHATQPIIQTRIKSNETAMQEVDEAISLLSLQDKQRITDVYLNPRYVSPFHSRSRSRSRRRVSSRSCRSRSREYLRREQSSNEYFDRSRFGLRDRSRRRSGYRDSKEEEKRFKGGTRSPSPGSFRKRNMSSSPESSTRKGTLSSQRSSRRRNRSPSAGCSTNRSRSSSVESSTREGSSPSLMSSKSRNRSPSSRSSTKRSSLSPPESPRRAGRRSPPPTKRSSSPASPRRRMRSSSPRHAAKKSRSPSPQPSRMWKSSSSLESAEESKKLPSAGLYRRWTYDGGNWRRDNRDREDERSKIPTNYSQETRFALERGQSTNEPASSKDKLPKKYDNAGTSKYP